MKLLNSQGSVYYGMHMHPGVVQYKDHGDKKGDYRVFLNEDTIRRMDPTFAARPVYVEHVDDVNEDLDALRTEADGWVSESFYNKADGKHWVKFIVVSERGEKAVANGYQLSNAYIAKKFANGGTWSGLDYHKQVVDADYDHLALVKTPRYKESIVLTPEEFKAYNEKHLADLEKFSNSEGKKKMKLTFFKKEKMKNSDDLDLESLSVKLPKSGKEVTIEKMVNELDEVELAKSKPVELDMNARVKVGDSEMTVTELIAAYVALNESIQELADEDDMSDDDSELDSDDDDEFENEDEDDDDEFENEDEEDKETKAEAAKAKAKASLKEKMKNGKKKMKNSLSAAEVKAKEKAKEKAMKLRFANSNNSVPREVARVDTSIDQAQRGQERYGRKS